MDPDLSEIDQLIFNMTSEKVGSNNDVVSHNVDELSHHDNPADDEFLESILNELTRGNVSNLDTIDDGTIAAVFPPGPATLPTENPIVNVNTNTTSTSQPFSSAINQPVNENSVVNQLNNNNASTPVSGLTVTYQLGDQYFMLVNPLSHQNNVPVVATPLPTPVVDIVLPPSVASSENDEQEIEVVATPGPSGSRKRKLYEYEEEFSDPEMEKKRQNAINAKRHRDMKKQTIQTLQNELKIVKQERDALNEVNDRQSLQSQQAQEALVKQVEDLKKEKEEMRKQFEVLQQQYQDSLQRQKIGFPEMNFSFDF